MSTTKHKRQNGAITVKQDGKIVGNIGQGKDVVPTAQNDANITNPNSPSALSKIGSFLGQHKNKILIAGAAGAFFMLGAIPALVVAGIGYWIIKRDFKDRKAEFTAEHDFATNYDINENGEGEITDETIQNSQKLTKLSRKQKATIAVAGTGLLLIGGLPAIALGGACVWLGLRNHRKNNEKFNTDNFNASDEHEVQSLDGDMVDEGWGATGLPEENNPEHEAQEQAEREAREQAEREAQEQAEREAREQAEREAQEQAEREAQEQAAREAQEQAAREQAEREAREQAAREQAAQEQAAREQAEREAREQAAREQAAREQAEREAREQAEQAAREQATREQAEREQAKPKQKAEPEFVLTPTTVSRPKKRSVPDSVTNPNSIFNDGSHWIGNPTPAKPQSKPAKPVAPAKRTTRKHTPAPAAFTKEQFESILQDAGV